MEWYGWLCAFALPVLIYCWVEDSDEARVLRSLRNVTNTRKGKEG
jgi:hypothetical protein